MKEMRAPDMYSNMKASPTNLFFGCGCAGAACS